VEKNGKTVRENNLARQHSIPLGALVDFEYEEYFGNGAGVAGRARMYVVDHARDCDGTPLYWLASAPREKWCVPGMSAALALQAPPLSLQGLYLASCYHLKGGYPEESLHPVELTADVLSGEGVPTLEDGEK
jgi:hypothetical protein